MITPAMVKACHSAEGVGALLAALGYPVTLREIDLSEWRLPGIKAPEGSRTVHAVRHAGVDLYVFEGSDRDAAVEAEMFVRVLAARNCITKTVAIYISPLKNAISLIAASRRDGGVSRLDVPLEQPPLEVLDRLGALAIDGAGKADARRIFAHALDREAVGRRFFERFRQSVSLIGTSIEAACPGESARECADQALLLLSRVLFLYFVQQKGWLDHNRRFLIERLERSIASGAGFHGSVLRPLFFDCLNTPVSSRREEALALGRIPYLNGGLFEPSAFERRNPACTVADDVWREVLESSFERFAFCVSEDREEGAHVDPEMLGKVFESLMEQSERAGSGSFYTPKPLVERLVTLAIVEWCANGEQAAAETLEALLRGDGARLPEPEAALAFLRRLQEIRVLDPACGSGAFLLAALRLLERMTRLLSGIAGVGEPPELRQRIVEQCLYGVDIKSEAVRLCELRLWLAIVSESSCDADNVPPLPNLDRNVLQGNALVGPLDFLGAGRAEIYRAWAYALRDREALVARYKHTSAEERRGLARALRESDQRLSVALLETAVDADRRDLASLKAPEPALFGCSGSAGKQKEIAALETRIDETSRLLDRVRRGDAGYFCFDVHCSGVMAKGGFDVIVGNPPWVRASRIEPSARRLYADRYEFFRRRDGRGFGQSELALAFCEKALALLAPGGVSAQLLPAKILNAGYAETMRRRIAEKHRVVSIVDWSRDGRRLFGADVFPAGLVVRQERPGLSGILVEGSIGSFRIGQEALSIAGAGSPWSIAPPEVRAVLSRLRSGISPLSETLRRVPVMGVKTGANELFFFDSVRVGPNGFRIDSLGIELPPGALVRCVRGRDLRRWGARDSTWMLWPPACAAGREPGWLVKLARAMGVETSRLRLDYVRPEHLGLKVGWKDLSRGLKAAVLPAAASIDGIEVPVVPNQTVYTLDAASMDEAFTLAALLNSSVVNALALESAEPAKDDHFRYLATTVASVPLPGIDAGDSRFARLSRLSRRAHAQACVDEEIDRLVAELFGLTAAERGTLERYVASKLGEIEKP